MLLAKAPLRISFVGGGTDLPSYCRRRVGRVISSTIDKYIYVAVNATPLVPRFVVKHREQVHAAAQVEDIEHPYVREALRELEILRPGFDVTIVSDLPGSTGLGSSSSLSVALMKALHAFKGQKLDRVRSAMAACRLEIDRLGEPIGKQDQYAAAIGGFNILEFHPDGSVAVEPVFLHFEKRRLLESWSLLFFTGITRSSSAVLKEQQERTAEQLDLYTEMADLVRPFTEGLLAGDMERIAEILSRGWRAKAQLSPKASTPAIDELYAVAIRAGALGGKVLGAGLGGCLYFLVPPEKRREVSRALSETAERLRLTDTTAIPIRFVQSGADLVFSDEE